MSACHSTPQSRYLAIALLNCLHCSSSTPGTNGRYNPTRSSRPSYLACRLAGNVIPTADDHECLQHLIRDQPWHLVPSAARGQRAEFFADLAPAMQLEHGAIRRRRGIESDLLSLRGDLIFTQGHKRHRRDLDRLPFPIGLLRACGNRRQHHLAQILGACDTHAHESRRPLHRPACTTACRHPQ